MKAEEKKITKEQMENILQAFYPGGYGRDNCRIHDESDGDYTWYIGWMGIGDGGITLPLEINLDAGGSSIVFMWWPQYCDEYTKDEIIGTIRGKMSMLMPDMRLRDYPSDGSNSVDFEFKKP